MLDLDPREFDSRDDERHSQTPSGRGSSVDHDRDHDWSQPDARTRDRDDGDERSLGRGPGNDRQGSDTEGRDRDHDPRWTDRDRDTRDRDREVRVEYQEPDGRWEREDIEVVTPHYRGAHGASVACSGFFCYRGLSLRLSTSGAGRSGGSRSHLDDQNRVSTPARPCLRRLSGGHP